LFAPSARFNYGIAPGWEAVIEGDVAHGLSSGTRGASLVGNGASLKGVLREGSLQENPGPSIATEFGILLPGIRAEHGTGASVAGIVSQRWEWVTLHLNAAAAVTRQQHADLFLGVIGVLIATAEEVQGPVFIASNGTVGLRGARVNDHTSGEIRDGGIRPVERTVGLRDAAPADYGRRRKHRDPPPHSHGVGRNTQIAAGSAEAARTATKSRSSSGTNSEVRAPDTVGTFATRPYPVSRGSSTSTAPSPQLT
jgi:hypothetical protein